MRLLSPVTAVVLGWVFLGQRLQGMPLPGLIIVMLSVLSLQWTLMKKPQFCPLTS